MPTGGPKVQIDIREHFFGVFSVSFATKNVVCCAATARRWRRHVVL